MRVLLMTGKGGVGKTTVAAATALRCADAGHETLVLSTDPAHSLADAFDIDLSDSVVPIAAGLHGLQLDAQARMEANWREIRTFLEELFVWAGTGAIEAEELATVPGLDEVFALADIKRFASDPRWDVIVVDCAPTAETIRLLSLPEILSWYMERLFPVGRTLNRVAAPVISTFTSIPTARDEVFGAVQRFYDRLDGVRDILADRSVTSARLVVNPERVVVAEARRTYTYLSLFGYGVDAVIANRLLPGGVSDPWFAEWKRNHADHLAAVERDFAPLQVLRAELAPHELVGVDRLRAFGAELYGAVDPADRLSDTEPMSVSRTEAGDVLRVQLPFTETDQLDLGRRDGELVVTVGPYRRSILLPDSLHRRPIVGAQMVDESLVVTFARRDD